MATGSHLKAFQDEVFRYILTIEAPPEVAVQAITAIRDFAEARLSDADKRLSDADERLSDANERLRAADATIESLQHQLNQRAGADVPEHVHARQPSAVDEDELMEKLDPSVTISDEGEHEVDEEADDTTPEFRLPIRPVPATRSAPAKEGLSSQRQSARRNPQGNRSALNPASTSANKAVADTQLSKRQRQPEKATKRDSGRKKARLEPVYKKDTSCFPAVYELLDDFPGKGWTNPDQPPPGIGQISPSDITGGYAWWCRTPHAEGDFCMSARRPSCPGCNLLADRSQDRVASFYIPYIPRIEGSKEEREDAGPGFAIFQKPTTWTLRLKAGDTEPHSRNAKASRLEQGLIRRGVPTEIAQTHSRIPVNIKLSKKALVKWCNEIAPQ